MKTAPQIKTTKDYEMFVRHEHQQPMSDSHIRNIAESMKVNGFLPSCPIQCYRRNDGKLGVIDGHHRLAAAALNGMYALYVVEPESHKDLISWRNILVRKWVNISFVRMYADKGNPNYLTLLTYIDAGFSVKSAASLLIGQSAHSGNAAKLLKGGEFKVKTTQYVDKITWLWEEVAEIAPDLKKQSYIDALSKLLFVEEFDIQTLAKRIEAMPRGISACANCLQALDTIEEVYNFRSREKVPLAHLARVAMKTRNAVKK